jgi:hypothetical protein
MKETIAQFLKVTKFPFEIKNKNGNTIYYEYSNNEWYKQEYDLNNKEIYYENSNGYWCKKEYDSNSNLIYLENSDGYWSKNEYDSDNNQIYFESSNGIMVDNRPKPSIELTLDEIADKLGINVSQLKIKK